jgi:hypothetical protein
MLTDSQHIELAPVLQLLMRWEVSPWNGSGYIPVFSFFLTPLQRCSSAVGTATGYGLDD